METTWEMSNWEKGTEDKAVLNNFLSEAKEAYKKEIGKLSLDDDDKLFFAWSENSLHIYLVKISDSLDTGKLLVIAVKDEKLSHDKITYIDKKVETDDGFFIHANDEQKLSMLFKTYHLKDTIDPKSVIKNSVYILIPGTPASIWVNLWIDREMKHTKEHFSLAPISLEFNNLGLHPQKFKINEIVKTVNDPQFTREFQECMNVFEEEYYYPAAAGLGGIMESLLYKTLDNYQRTSNKFLGSDPTLLDYLNALKRLNLIDRRQSSRIRASFIIRNSISHYNQGFTAVSDIESMLHGIENIFTTLYVQSQEWKEAHPNEQLPEPGRHDK